jgi:serine kinase
MEYSSSGDLFDYVLKRRFIPEPQACLWFKQLISAVEHIHKNGFAHRDLKCENLLLSSNYDIKLTDFGFCCKLKFKKNSKTQKPEEEKSDSKMTAQECRSKTFCGSLIYASPELLRGQPYLPTKTDIW